MSRTRLIKPGFFLNEELGRLPPLDRILFAGLWTIADREGRLEDRPLRIKAKVLPFDDYDIEAALVRLDAGGFIQRYVVSHLRCIRITTWHKHQRIHFKEAASELPEFTEESSSTNLGECEHQPKSPLHSCSTSTSTSTSESESESREPRPRLVLDAEWTAPASPARPLREADAVQESSVGFVEFWSAYRLKKGKGTALRAWQKQGCAGFAPKIMATLERMQAEDDQWNRGYQPHAATWLNAGGWDDEPVAAPRPHRELTAAERQMAVIRRTDELFNRLNGGSHGPVGSEEAGEQPGRSLSPGLVGRASGPVHH